MDKNQRALYGQIVSRAWEDEAFKKHFLTSPEEVLKEAGITVEEGVEYKVIEAPKLVQYLVLPHENQRESLEKLSKILLSKAEQNQAIVPESVELRVIQNTDSIRHLVLPSSPKTLTAAELKMVAGGDSVGTASNIDPILVTPAASVVQVTTVSNAVQTYACPVAVAVQVTEVSTTASLFAVVVLI